MRRQVEKISRSFGRRLNMLAEGAHVQNDKTRQHQEGSDVSEGANASKRIRISFNSKTNSRGNFGRKGTRTSTHVEGYDLSRMIGSSSWRKQSWRGGFILDMRRCFRYAGGVATDFVLNDISPFPLRASGRDESQALGS
jgi:hypothetical protein